LGPEAAWEGEDGAPLALGELCVPLGLRGFRDSSTVLSAWGLGGLSTFWGFATDHGTLCRRVRVDALGHSTQSSTSYKAIKNFFKKA
jgi:hypothetical protein